MQKVDYNLVNIFTIYSHHLNVTCLLLTQSLFLSNKIYRVLSLNTHYIVLMKNTRDSSSVSILAKQTHPFRTRFVTDAYLEATKEPFSYLMKLIKNQVARQYLYRFDLSLCTKFLILVKKNLVIFFISYFYYVLYNTFIGVTLA